MAWTGVELACDESFETADGVAFRRSREEEELKPRRLITRFDAARALVAHRSEAVAAPARPKGTTAQPGLRGGVTLTVGGGMAQREQLEQAIEAQEKLPGAIPDDVVDAAIGALHEQLAGLEQSEERRRQVTVLFADVSGFTTLSDHRDPEVITELMNALWTRLDAAHRRRRRYD